MNEEEILNKLNLILENQEKMKALHLLELRALDFLVSNELGPEDFLQNFTANIMGDEFEWNRRGRFK